MMRRLAAFLAIGCGGCQGSTDTPSPAPAPAPAAVAPAPAEGPAAEARWLRNARQLTTHGRRSGEQYFDARGGRVIFMSVPDDYPFFQIYVLDALDGTVAPRLVSTGRGRTTCPWFHPDGTRFLYASSHLDPDLDATEAAAREAERTPPAAGRRYQWDFDAHMDVFEARLDGTILRRVTDAPGYDAECSYDAAGARILFTSQRDGDLELYVMNADGSAPRRLTHAPGYDGGPFFSPDGTQICWRGDRRGDDKLQLFVADADGGNVRQLTDDDAVNWGPFWHPDGRRLIYATSRHGHRNYELYLVDVATRREERITFTEGFDGLPAFSPDGRRLLWTSRRGGGDSQVWIADFVDAWAGR
jgi:Tol biopolymer transport system component